MDSSSGSKRKGEKHPTLRRKRIEMSSIPERRLGRGHYMPKNRRREKRRSLERSRSASLRLGVFASAAVLMTRIFSQ